MKLATLVIQVLTLVVIAVGSAPAWSAELPEEAQRCVQITRIKSTEILSNRQILFEMKGGQHYVNTLPFPCPGMRPHSVLMYRTSINMLCNVDVVTLLDSWGAGFLPAASCGLGMFEPLDEGEVDALRKAARESN